MTGQPALFAADGIDRSARLSPCGTWRYELHRRWGPGTSVLWIMLNPSTADAEVDDPTVRRCVGFTRAWGHDALTVVNLYALRATDPAELGRHPDPVGPENGEVVRRQVAAGHALVIAAWGAGVEKAMQVSDRYRTGHLAAAAYAHDVELHCLGTTAQGHPRHPLYVRGDITPQPYLGGAS